MKITRKSFMTGISAAVLIDWTKLVFADGAPRPFGAGARILDGRIQRLLARALDHDVFPKPVKVEYDPADMSLPEPIRIGKRLAEYMAAQPVKATSIVARGTGRSMACALEITICSRSAISPSSSGNIRARTFRK